ncbi:protein AIR1-like [Haliotis rufescens]|uniref:protein AIR1-like n=1 Tax=Haliotis rufescens TaxID=6454 RepID=UPI00201E8237|nr:protein AIR1-like [Haliotis rufescens]
MSSRYSCMKCQTDSHSDLYCPEVTCTECHTQGHRHYVCPKISSQDKQKTPQGACYNCQVVGHFAADCPEPSRKKTSAAPSMLTPVAPVAQVTHVLHLIVAMHVDASHNSIQASHRVLGNENGTEAPQESTLQSA